MSQEVRKSITGIRNVARKLKPGLSSVRLKTLHNDILKHSKRLYHLTDGMLKPQLIQLRDILFNLTDAQDFILSAKDYRTMRKKLMRICNAVAMRLGITRS